MDDFVLVEHAKGAPGLRILGLGPRLIPHKSLDKLIKLFNNNTSWAANRSKKEVNIMLSKSRVIVSLWKDKELVGFGRATSDESYRAVLWDIVIDRNYQREGLGKKIVQSLLKNPAVSKAEKIYIMTTFCTDFYTQMGFVNSKNQNLMVIQY